MENYRSIYHQTLAVIPVCLSEFSMGIGYGWLAPMLQIFLEDPNSELKPTEDECSWIGSLPGFGRTFGPLFSILLLDTVGRKIMIQLAMAFVLTPWLAVLFTRSVIILCGSFFIFGLGVGICNADTVVYLGENCSPKIRGIFCSISVTCFAVAVLIQYSIAGYLSYNSIGIINFIAVFGCLIACSILAIESPQFLMLKGDFDKAEKNMMWLKGTDNRDNIRTEFENIKSNIASEKLKKTSRKELFLAPANLKSLIIVLTLNMAYMLTGNAAITTYISLMFPKIGPFNSNQITVFFGISQLVFCLLAMIIIEMFDRRSVTLFGFALFLLCHSIAIYFLHEIGDGGSSASMGTWVVFATICIYCGFSAVFDSVIPMLRGELFPQSIKPIGSGLAISVHSLMQFLTIKIFLTITSQYGVYVNFLAYAVVSLVSFLFCYFALPETRGKTLIEIQQLLEKPN